jgi:hypothetical protein
LQKRFSRLTVIMRKKRRKRGDVTHCTQARKELASCSDDTVTEGSDPEEHNYSHLGPYSDEQAKVTEA